MNASSSFAKRAAADAASGWTKLLVRNSASEFSPHCARRQALAHGARVESRARRQRNAWDAGAGHQLTSEALCSASLERLSVSSSSPWAPRCAAIASKSAAVTSPVM